LPYAYDAIDGVVTVRSSHASGANFTLGVTTVTFTAIDRAGNRATATMDINVVQGTTTSQQGGVAGSTAPFLPNLNDQYVKPNEIRRVVLQAEDADGDPVTFRLSSFFPNVTLGNYDPIARQATLFIGPRAANASPLRVQIEASDNKQQSYKTLPFLIATSEIPNDDTGSGTGSGGGGGRSNRNPNAVIAPLPATIEATEVDSVVLSLSARLSNDPDLDSLTYEWNVDGRIVAQTVTTDVTLGLGAHVITLTVRDGRGGVGRATARIQVLPRSLSVKSVTPSRLSRNSTTTLVITGTGFSDRASVFIPGGAIFTESYLSRTESLIVATVRVASSANPGTREVIVINPDGKTASLRAALTIQ
jgi:hypothetical protein